MTNQGEASTPAVVVGVDGSDEGHTALAKAKDLSLALGSFLYVVHVRHLPGWWSLGATAPAAIETLGQLLDEVEGQVKADVEATLADHPHWTLTVVEGDPVDELIKAAETHHAIAIVVGSHGHRRFSPFVLGSVSAGLVHRATESVLVVRTPQA